MREMALKLKHLGREGGRLTACELMAKLDGQPIPVRLAKVAVMQSIGSKPFNTLLDCAFGKDKVLSAGYEQIVFRDGPDRVKKIVMNSNNYPMKGRDPVVVATELQDINKVCEECAPNIWTPTHFTTEETEGLMGRERIVARQPLVVTWLDGEIMPDNLIRRTDTTSYRRVFAQNVMNIIEKLGLVPDFGGSNNVLLGDCQSRKGLYIVDTIPVDVREAKKKRFGRQSSDYDEAMGIVEACYEAA